MKLAFQFAARQDRLIARVVGPVRDAVRAGRSMFCCFDHPNGTTRLDLMGPNGMIGGSNDGFLCLPYRLATVTGCCGPTT